MEFSRALWNQLGITGWEALAVVISSALLYVFFAVIISVFGQSLRARVSIFSFALFALLGSVTARSMLGDNPTMAGGFISLTVLLILELSFARLRSGWVLIRPRRAKAVVVDGVIHPEMLVRSRLSEPQLWTKLRGAGIRQLSEVHLAIIESDGSLTLYRTGDDIDPRLLVGVLGLPE
jgi:uncharacterized membrane protein YcaP (DUF421 family)